MNADFGLPGSCPPGRFVGGTGRSREHAKGRHDRHERHEKCTTATRRSQVSIYRLGFRHENEEIATHEGKEPVLGVASCER